MIMNIKIFVALYFLNAPIFLMASPQLRGVDNTKGSGIVRITANFGKFKDFEKIIYPKKRELFDLHIPGAWVQPREYVKIEIIDPKIVDPKTSAPKDILRTHYLQVNQWENGEAMIPVLKVDPELAGFELFDREEDVNLYMYGDTPTFKERTVLSENIHYRDGCKAIGDYCACESTSTNVSEKCKKGICLKGFRYGQESVYCNCTLRMLSDTQIQEVEKKQSGPLPTDSACSRKPLFGYSGEGFDELGEKLKKLNFKANLFVITEEPNSLQRRHSFSELINANAIIDEVVAQVKNELSELYAVSGIPNASLIYMYEGTGQDAWKRPCDHFRKLLKDRVWKASVEKVDKLAFHFTQDAESAFLSLCSEKSTPKNNYDPCICTDTLQPGYCRVNSCEMPLKLKCWCD